MPFTFKLEHVDGTPADPPVLQTVVPNWSAGDTIPFSAERTLRVIETRFVDEQPVLVVESAWALSPARHQRDRITAPLDGARTRALADHTAAQRAPRANAAHPANRAVPLPDPPLRRSES
jgi:hypothetical protein